MPTAVSYVATAEELADLASSEGEVRTVHPGRAVGSVRAPPSKSYTHRALAVGALLPPGRELRVISPLVSDDTEASVRVLRALDVDVQGWPLDATPKGNCRLTLVPPAEGRPGRAKRGGSSEVDVGESGTTLRFFSAIAARRPGPPLWFFGEPGLAVRPMVPLFEALDRLGARREGPPSGKSLPFSVHGPLRPGRIELPGEVSSQFISAVLLVLPTLAGESQVRITGTTVSAPYIEATVAVLEHEGVEVEATSEGYRVPGGQTYGDDPITVPGDASSAAYALALGALTGGSVRVTGLSASWPQADRKILEVLRWMGASVREASSYVEVSRGRGAPEPFEVDLDPSPDLAPLLAVLASFSKGRSVLRGGAHLAAKESDRRAACLRLARSLGAKARDDGSTLVIEGPEKVTRLELLDLSDHRVLFSAAVAAAALSAPSRIGDVRAASKSYPGFFDDLSKLGIRSSAVPSAEAR